MTRGRARRRGRGSPTFGSRRRGAGLRSARKPSEIRSTGAGLSWSGWADLAVVPLIVTLGVPTLVWFAHDWTVGNDAARSLFAASELVLGQGLQTSNDLPSNGGHGPVFPA